MQNYSCEGERFGGMYLPPEIRIISIAISEEIASSDDETSRDIDDGEIDTDIENCGFLGGK